MKNNHRKTNFYTQGQRWAVGVLLMVGLASGPERVLAIGPAKMAQCVAFGALGLFGGGDALALKENDPDEAGNQLCLPKGQKCLDINKSFFAERGFPEVWEDLTSAYNMIYLDFKSNDDTCNQDLSDKHQEVAEAILIFTEDHNYKAENNNHKEGQKLIVLLYLLNGCIQELNFNVLPRPLKLWDLDLTNNQIENVSSLVHPEKFSVAWIDLDNNPACNNSEKVLCEDLNFQKLLNNYERIYCSSTPVDCSTEASGPQSGLLAPSSS